MITRLASLALPLVLATTAPPAPASTPPGSTPPATGTPIPVPAASTIAGLLALGRPIVLAHTAGEDAYPGSTMFGFTESAKAGVDMLDFNVTLSKDDVLVVQHDLTVDRLTNATGNVVDKTYAELAALDNAYWFTGQCGACTDKPADAYVFRGVRTGEKPAPAGYTAEDFKIPTLQDVLTAFPAYTLNIEIKGEGALGARTAKVLAEELTAAGALDRVVVTSFDDATVDAFRALAPSVELSPGLTTTTQWVLGRVSLPSGMRILQLPPTYNGLEILNAKQVEDAHAAGYLIWVWPNNRSEENLDSYRAFLALGLDGLNINFPVDGVRAVAGAAVPGSS